MKTALMQKMMAGEKQMRDVSMYGASGGSENRGIPGNIKVSDLPFETHSDFSNAPFDFENTARMLWEDTLKIYDHACIENRFSENYLKYCTQLEKNIKQVGSLCLTKAVLEKNGIEFPQLETMTVRELVGMVSFHLLKCHAALDGIYKDNNYLGLTYLNWEIRWFELGNRLKATEVKIQKIREGKINTAPLLEQAQTFKDAPRTNLNPAQPQSLRMNPNALPLKGSMAREMLRTEAEKEKALARERREEARWERELMELGLMAKPFQPLSRRELLNEMMSDRMEAIGNGTDEEEEDGMEPVPEPESTESTQEARQSGKLTEAEARLLLIERAREEGDEETAAAIRTEDTEAFYQRWLRFVEEKDVDNRKRVKAAKGRAGPSNSTRKKLREKRKKKK